MPSAVSTDLTSSDTNGEYKEKRGYERPERTSKKWLFCYPRNSLLLQEVAPGNSIKNSTADKMAVLYIFERLASADEHLAQFFHALLAGPSGTHGCVGLDRLGKALLAL